MQGPNHVGFFYQWIDSNDQNENDFLISRTEVDTKLIQGLK